MRSKGWKVTGTDYNHEQQTYIWTATSLRSKHTPTLRISRTSVTGLK
jgi:hypothetical protein